MVFRSKQTTEGNIINYASEKEGEENNSKKAATHGSVNEDSLKIRKSIFPEAEASESKKKQEWSAPLEGRAAEAYDSRVRGRSIEERAERLEKAAKKLGKAQEGEKDRDQLRRSSIKRIEELSLNESFVRGRRTSKCSGRGGTGRS